LPEAFGGAELNTTLIGTRLQDENGVDFLVINVPWNWLATPVDWDTTTAVSIFEFPLVFASRREDGRWFYLGENSLTAICESRLGQEPTWQEIVVLPEP
jgi:hypothetical protein